MCVWAARATDNKLIYTVGTNLGIRFAFGEIVLNPIVALIFLAIIPAAAFYYIVPDITQQMTKQFIAEWAEAHPQRYDEPDPRNSKNESSSAGEHVPLASRVTARVTQWITRRRVGLLCNFKQQDSQPCATGCSRRTRVVS